MLYCYVIVTQRSLFILVVFKLNVDNVTTNDKPVQLDVMFIEAYMPSGVIVS